MLGGQRPTSPCLAKSVAVVTGDVPAGNERGTMWCRCGVLHTPRVVWGIQACDNRPMARGARRVSPEDTIQRCRVPSGTAWQVDDAPHGGQGTPVPSCLRPGDLAAGLLTTSRCACVHEAHRPS